jgi:hypothetical protein
MANQVNQKTSLFRLKTEQAGFIFAMLLLRWLRMAKFQPLPGIIPTNYLEAAQRKPRLTHQ